MSAALKTAGEAIVRAASPEELFQAVCDAAVHCGLVGCAAVLLADVERGLRIVAGAGEDVDRLQALDGPAGSELHEN